MVKLSGVLPALLTPMDSSGRLDEQAFRAHLDALIDAGVHGVVPVGSTGEFASLDRDEYRRVISLTVEHVAGRVRVVAGCSANATHHVIENCRFAQESGADGLLITHPFYSHPSEDELFEHYADIARAVELPIVIYNNPGTTGIDASPELFGRLATLPHVEYVKETSGDSARITRILECSKGELTVFSGQDNQALEHFVCGAGGWISASANVIPSQCVALYRLAVEQHDFIGARALYREIHPFLTYAETSGRGIQVLKESMRVVGRPLGAVRPPLRRLPKPMFDEATSHVQRALRAPLPD
jgi:4-hydroxy-tetrahydrodipicolinate synthase